MLSFQIRFILFTVFFVGLLCLSGCDNKSGKEEAAKPQYIITDNSKSPRADSNLIYEYVQKQLEFGPRVTGTRAHSLTKNYFIAFLRNNADKVEIQDFTLTGYDNEKLELTNIIARFNPESSKRIFLCAHWDSRPRSDQEKDTVLQKIPVMGANDGASGVAILLEMSRILKVQKVDYGVDLILLDGEDYGKSQDLSLFCLGSKYFAANKKDYSPIFGILLDMVGDKDAQFLIEENSTNYGSDITSIVWESAKKTGAYKFVDQPGHSIYDDHIPLNQAGLKTIDIIDAALVGADSSAGRRSYWHTTKDTIENIGKDTMRQVADVLLNILYSIKFNS